MTLLYRYLFEVPSAESHHSKMGVEGYGKLVVAVKIFLLIEVKCERFQL